MRTRQNRTNSNTDLFIRRCIYLLLVADSGPGDTTDKGLIVPKFGKNPENHVAVSMSFDLLCELLLETKINYQAWFSTWDAASPARQSDPRFW